MHWPKNWAAPACLFISNIQSITDAADAAAKVGLFPTIALLVVLSMLAVFLLIVRWLMKQIEDRNTQIEKTNELIEKANERTLKAMEVKGEVLSMTEAALRQTAASVERSTDYMQRTIERIADEMRRK